MKNKILVLGGKGKTGRKVAERLISLGQVVRIGSRSESPAFNWDDPSNWNKVLNGMDMAYITFQPDLAVPGAVEKIETFTSAAVENGIKKLVLLSGKGETQAQLCEDVIKNSGINWTIVRASWFNQNFSESFFLDPILAGTVALPKAEMPIPFIDTNDIADVVAAALLDSKHSQKTYQLTGPRQLTFKQVIEEISEASGREIKFIPITIDEYEKMLRKNDVPEDYIWLIKYLFTEVLTNENSIVTNDVEKVLERKPIDFKEYVKVTAKTGVWSQANKEAV